MIVIHNRNEDTDFAEDEITMWNLKDLIILGSVRGIGEYLIEINSHSLEFLAGMYEYVLQIDLLVILEF